MKTKFTLIALLCLLFSIQSLFSQVYKYVPDPNFRNYLSTTLSCPFDPSGDSLDISSSTVSSINLMNLPSSMSNLNGIQYFTNLTTLFINSTSINKINYLPNSISYLQIYSNANLNSIDSLPLSLTSFHITYSILLDSLCNLPPNLIELHCNNNNLIKLPSLPASLELIECIFNPINILPTLPPNLISLGCSNTNISILPTLPITLEDLVCANSNISSLPSLPLNLKRLVYNNNFVTVIPTLPASLLELECSNNGISILPSLPSNLTSLDCSGNLISSLPLLPSSLEYLKCYDNVLTSIPALPSNLVSLECQNNLIISLPVLPPLLMALGIDNNQLTSLPTLPSNLDILSCGQNLLTSIPELPHNLDYLNVDNNPNLNCLPYLTNSLIDISYTGTSISCIPNFVSGANYNPPIGTFPFCNPSFHACPSFNSIEGTTYKDANSNCINDLSEDKLMNIPLVLQNGGSTVYQISTASNGTYAFDTLPIGIYTTHIDTLELPFDVYCPVSGYDTIHKDSITDYFTNRDFGLNCKPDFDLAIRGMHTTSLIRPASNIFFNLHAGDVSKLYGTSCTNIAATITMNYTGHLNYTGVVAGSLVPDTILPNHLVWNIADVSTLNFYYSIAPTFNIDSTATSGDLLCFNTSISPNIGDRIPTNNNYTQCFTVVASYDPNYKEANPSGSITSSQDWINYTIHFQNMGTSYAENIYVWDTISNFLNLNTIQVIGASHNQIMQVNPVNRAVLFNFSNIFLLDSTTDEAASHGWVQYRIKPIAGLTEGIQINNTAGILFDLNSPIYTNTTSNRICNTPSNISQTYTLIEGQSITVGSHNYNQSGSYTDILSNVNGCDSIVQTTIQIVSGIGESTPLRLITYPNPASNLVQIEIEGIPNMPLSIVDMYGRTVYENTSIGNRYSINTEALLSGNYIIQYGRYHQKLVINH